ncbi:hypothetical protein JZ751_020344, partial [Albula glossodonta]
PYHFFLVPLSLPITVSLCSSLFPSFSFSLSLSLSPPPLLFLSLLCLQSQTSWLWTASFLPLREACRTLCLPWILDLSAGTDPRQQQFEGLGPTCTQTSRACVPVRGLGSEGSPDQPQLSVNQPEGVGRGKRSVEFMPIQILLLGPPVSSAECSWTNPFSLSAVQAPIPMVRQV